MASLNRCPLFGAQEWIIGQLAVAIERITDNGSACVTDKRILRVGRRSLDRRGEARCKAERGRGQGREYSYRQDETHEDWTGPMVEDLAGQFYRRSPGGGGGEAGSWWKGRGGRREGGKRRRQRDREAC